MKNKNENPPAAAPPPAPVPANRVVTSGMVKVRAVGHLGETVDGVVKHFAPGEELEITAARAAALGPLVRLLTVLLLLITVSAPAAAGYISATATGSTTAAVMFPGGSRLFRLVTLDVTSDKAASTAQWRYSTTPFEVALAAAAGDTNLYLVASSLTTNNVVFAQSSAEVPTNFTVWGTNALTNVIFQIDRPLGTNLAIGDVVKKIGTVAYPLAGDASPTTTNYLTAATNGLAANDVVIVEHNNQILKGTIHSVLSNSFNLTATLGTNLSAFESFYKLTNSHAVMLPAVAADATLALNNNTNLSSGNLILVSPASGGDFKFIYNGATTQAVAKVITTAAIGIPLARSGTVYLRGGTNSTPVGAATVRLYGTIFVGGAGGHGPAQLVLDGTSACTINNAVVDYGP